MGIIGRNHPKQSSGSGTTVVAAGTELVGNLALEDNLHIDGRVKGDVESKAEVIIGKPGHMEGQIKAERVLISGSFDGSIEAERLEIVSSGKLSGEVTVGQLVVESGAHFNGTSRIRGDEPPRQLTHSSAAADGNGGSPQSRGSTRSKNKADNQD
jgi:cytoskeletal protein CcmA (bactofilin family)